MRLSTISSILNSFTSLKGEGISYFGEGEIFGVVFFSWRQRWENKVYV
jgi:hypothetical protein